MKIKLFKSVRKFFEFKVNKQYSYILITTRDNCYAINEKIPWFQKYSAIYGFGCYAWIYIYVDMHDKTIYI